MNSFVSLRTVKLAKVYEEMEFEELLETFQRQEELTLGMTHHAVSHRVK